MDFNFELILTVIFLLCGLCWLMNKSIRADEDSLIGFFASLAPVLGVVLVLRSFLYEPFQIPSSSMVPTLEVGDYILVNKYAYGLRLPVTRTKVFELGEPERGDVMVFFPPHQNQTYYIKRVIGKPGDRVAYRNKQLTVNGEPVPQAWLAEIPTGRYAVKMGREILPDTDGHLMQIDSRRPPRTFSVVVKPGHYFMMGDNRDNSRDSRTTSVGMVPAENMVGRADRLFFSHNGNARLWEIWKWPFAIRYGRIGDGII